MDLHYFYYFLPHLILIFLLINLIIIVFLSLRIKVKFNFLLEKFKEAIKLLQEKEKELKEANLKLSLEKDESRLIVSNLTDGLIVFDNQGKVILSNPQAEKLLCLEKEGLLKGKTLEEISKIPRLEKFAKMIIEYPIAKKVNLYRKIFSIGDYQKRILEITSFPLIQGKEKKGLGVVIHDATREKKIEKMRNEFIKIVSHQLRAPLSGMRWSLELLLSNKESNSLSEKQREILRRCLISNERMIKLINDLLELSRIESEGVEEDNFIFASLESVVERVIDKYSPRLEEKKINLIYNHPSSPLPRVKMDPQKIGIVVGNLLENAINYSPQGGKIIITLSLEEKKRDILFSIKDNGPGISEEQVGKIFNKFFFTRFFRGANLLEMKEGGMGIGLYMSRKIIENHGGKIWVESKQGAGATFYFTLPLS